MGSRTKMALRATARKAVEAYAIGVVAAISVSLIVGAVAAQSVLRRFGRASMDPPS